MTCPICKKPSHPDFTPFCSKTCTNIDLLRWMNEDYRLPTQEPVVDDDEEADRDDQ